MATANTITIDEICKKDLHFFIPSYQRGYRWTVTQMKELVTDIYSFVMSPAKDASAINSCYCVQPIIVKKINDDNHWIVVDGQQRLTAIWLILSLGSCMPGVINKSQYFELTYEKKDELENLLKCIQSEIWGKTVFAGSLLDSILPIIEPYANKSVDCLNIVENLKWIAGDRENEEECLFKGEPISYLLYLPMLMQNIGRVEVIWYELDEKEDDEIITFANINANKIKLTNSELLKAMLLNQVSDTVVDMQNMAYTWEQLEKGLHNDSLWYFIMNTKVTSKKAKIKARHYSTRLDYLFEIWCVSEKDVRLDQDDTYAIFHAVDKELKKSQHPKARTEEIWENIQQIYEVIQDWYSNYNWYHMIGALIALNDESIESSDAKLVYDLYSIYERNDKKTFREELISRLTKHFFVSTYQKGNAPQSLADTKIEDVVSLLQKINYPSNSVPTLLLLYNIALLVNAKNQYERFPFDLYSSQYWEVEHINPQTPHEMGEAEKKAWAKSYKGFFTDIKENGLYTDVPGGEQYFGSKDDIDAILSELEDFMNDVKDENSLAVVSQHIESVLKLSGKPDDNDNIQNLVLLDQITNRSYKNACFSDKRAEIIMIERNMKIDDALVDKKFPKKRFILLGTKWVFLKGFKKSRELLVWGKTDMEAYKKDIAKNLILFLGGKIDGEDS